MHVLCIIGTTHQYYIGKKTNNMCSKVSVDLIRSKENLRAPIQPWLVRTYYTYYYISRSSKNKGRKKRRSRRRRELLPSSRPGFHIRILPHPRVCSL